MASDRHLPLSGTTFAGKITDIAFPRDFGVCRFENLVVFVPGAVPGDRGLIQLDHVTKNLAYGTIERLDEAAPSRVRPPCPHFGLCGGCSLQHISYDTQLTLKTGYLTETLRRVGKIDLPSMDLIHPIIPSPRLFFYRERLELAVAPIENRMDIGLRARSGMRTRALPSIVPITGCHLFDESGNRLIGSARKILWSLIFPPSSLSPGQTIGHVVLRASKTGNGLMVVGRTTARFRQQFTSLLTRLSEETPGMACVLAEEKGPVSRYTGPARFEYLAGDPFLTHRLCDRTFLVSPNAFFQPNPGAAEHLYHRLSDTAALRGTENVLGIYSGIGPIEIILSSEAQHVLAIDSSHDNVENGRENCRINKITNCTFIEGKAETILSRRTAGSFDLVVVDPPRGGLHLSALKALADLSVPRMAYISCNPSTLARDLHYLCDKGYMITAVMPYDFFPHTSHIETFCLLER